MAEDGFDPGFDRRAHRLKHMVKRFGISEDTARLALEAAGWNYEKAVKLYQNPPSALELAVENARLRNRLRTLERHMRALKYT